MQQILLVFLTAFLVTAFQSKRDICALYSAGEFGYEEAKRRLGIGEDGYLVNVDRFCLYYQS